MVASSRAGRAALLALLVTCCVPAVRGQPLPPETVQPRPVEQQAGWLMNRAQQHQAEWEIQASIRALAAALEDDPQEGFAHQLLGQSLTHGMGLGAETVAVYDHLARLEPDRPVRRVHARLARLEQHRADRFLGPTLPWFAESLAELEAVAAEPEAPPRARHEARLARRNLFLLVKDSEAARAEGMAAWELLPERLQGRITRLSRAVADRDVAASLEGCLGILRTDPWAVEACSMVWGLAQTEDPELKAEALQAREDVLEEVAALRPRAVADPVVGNEVVKFYKRIKAEDDRRALVAALNAEHGAFRYLDARNWYMRGPFRPSQHLPLLQGTNRALGIGDEAKRMERLRELADLLPEPLVDDPAVTRYGRALLKTARALGEEHRDSERTALQMLCEHDSGIDHCFELALVLEQDGAAPERLLELTWRSLERLESELAWVPLPDGKAQFDFSRWAGQRRGDRDRFLDAETRWRSAAEPTEGWSSPLVDAWPVPDDGSGWVHLAVLPDLPEPLALHAHIEALSLLGIEEQDALDPAWKESAARRFEQAFPMVTVADAEPWWALLAAARGRRASRGERPGGGKPPHPFVGKPAPDLDVTTMDGRAVSLAGLRGQVVLVDFWATWCAPCIKELPLLQAALEEMAGQPVRMLALSTDETLDVVAPFLADEGYTFDVAWVGESGTKQEWAVRGIPSLFVIDPEGVVRHHHQGFREDVGVRVRQQVEGLLATP